MIETTSPAPDAPATPSPRSIVYRLWNGAIPAAVCDAVIGAFDEEELYDATVQLRDRPVEVLSDARKTRHTFVDPGHWTGSLVSHFAHLANLLWRFDVSGLGTLSILRYEESGRFAWHVDALTYDTTDYGALGKGLERKLSVTVNLSSPTSYEGGDLEFMNSTGQLLAQPQLREQGSVVVFPSTVGHQVTPVTAGVRYALVGWMVGPPLR
ncbi:2OG-Fe(II) oxygenase [Pimelobacter simplex]|uniref:2OG-Fe(II) oxygenase n=1 Tax=Nocardioides simplex TaxID=2045 RepID=UPI003AAC957E